MADAIEEAARAPLATDEGRALAEERRALMLEFAARLRREHAEFDRTASRGREAGPSGWT